MVLELIPNWKKTMMRGYSPWLILVAALFSGLEIALPFIPVEMTPGAFAGVSLLVSATAYVARFIVQKELHEDENE